MRKMMICGLGLTMTLSALAITPRHGSLEFPQRNTEVRIEKGEPVNSREAAPRHSATRAEDDDWQFIGQGTMTDFVVGDLFWTSARSFSVNVEQSKSDPNTYRIPHPYANWSDPSISRYVKYDGSKDTPMVIHVYNGMYAWFEEFDTGLDLDLSFAGFPDKGELNVKMWGEDMVREYGVQVVAAEGPSALCGFTNGILSMSAFGRFRDESSHNILCDIGGKYAAGGNYYVANYDGEFRIVLPTSSEDAEWQHLGTGKMTECAFSSMFGLAPKTVNVEVDQSIIDPTMYRIKAPYAAWYDQQLANVCYFDEEMATPMIIHVEEGQFAWFESFDTGVYLNYTGGTTSLKGEVTMLQQAEQLVTQFGFINVANYWPDALCAYSDGVLTLGEKFSMDGNEYTNVLLSIGNNEGYYTANMYGNFRIELPVNGNNDDADWVTVGTAEYTDDLLTLLYGDTTPEYQTWEVELQQYKKDQTMYRLVNPYLGWQNPFSDVVYDDTQDYNMVIYTLPALGLACIGDFETGMYLQGLGMMGITTDAFYYSAMYGLDFTAQLMPELFASFNGTEITYPAYIMLEGERYPSMFAWFGTYSDEGLYQVNRSGKFRIKFIPGGDNAVDSIMDGEAEAEYYTLQGIRVNNPQPGELLIVRQGSKSRKIIF